MIPGPATNQSSAVLEDTFSLATCTKVYRDTVDCTYGFIAVVLSFWPQMVSASSSQSQALKILHLSVV